MESLMNNPYAPTVGVAVDSNWKRRLAVDTGLLALLIITWLVTTYAVSLHRAIYSKRWFLDRRVAVHSSYPRDSGHLRSNQLGRDSGAVRVPHHHRCSRRRDGSQKETHLDRHDRAGCVLWTLPTPVLSALQHRLSNDNSRTSHDQTALK